MFILLLVLFMLVSSTAHAAGVTAWHQLSNASTQAQSPRLASESHPDGVTLDISIPGYVTHSLQAGGYDYQTINLPDWQSNSEIGAPLVPQLDRCIAIPNNCRLEDISVDFLVSDTVSSNFSLAPVPKSVNSILSFIPDPAIYTQDNYYPQNPITIEKTGFIRDQKTAWIRINPVQYNPVSNKILIHKNLTLKIRFDNQGTSKLGPFQKIGPILFLNVEKSSEPPSRPSGPGSVTYPTDLLNASVNADYILITTEGLIHEAVLDSLAHYRANFSGLALAVVNTSDIYTQFPAADSSFSIRNFLISAFNRWTSAVSGDGHPLYVLLVGNGIPASPWGIRTFGSTCTDHLYSCVNDDNGDGAVNLNDWMPDFLLGRLSIRDPSDLTAFLAKIQPYEASLVGGADWRKKICLVNGFLDPLIEGEVDGQYYFIRKDIEAQDYFSLSESLDADDSSIPSVRESFINAINEGRGILNVESHGLPDGWVDTGGQVLLKGGDVSFLNNGDRLPIILSFSCFTGRFNDPAQPCLGELFVNAAGRGAAAFIGSTLDEDLHDNLRINGNMIEILMNSQGIDIGTAFMALKLNGQMSHMGYNLLGDPAMSFAQKPVVSRLPDLAVADIRINGTEHYVSSVSATIKNLGLTTAYGISVALFNGNPAQGGRPGSGSIQIGRLSPSDGEEKIAFSVGYLNTETFEPYLRVDPGNSIPEMSKDNNTAHLPPIRLLPDLFVSAHGSGEIPESITIARNSDSENRVKIIANIENHSNVTAENIIVRFISGSPDSLGITLAPDAVIDSITGNSTKLVSITSNPLQVEDIAFIVSIDPGNTIEEGDESNNIKTAYYRKDVFSFVETGIKPDQFIAYSDLNGDGLTDALTRNYAESRLGFARNLGNFHLDVSGVDNPFKVYDSIAFILDADNDGRLDVLLSGSTYIGDEWIGEYVDLLQNKGDFLFVRQPVALSMSTEFHQSLNWWAMRLVWDMNNDGLPDIVPNFRYYHLPFYFQNLDGSHFQGVPMAMDNNWLLPGPYDCELSTFGDYNGDGELEYILYLIEHRDNVKRILRLKAFHRNQDNVFSDCTERLGLDSYVDSTRYSSPNLSFTSIDYDSDGDLDLLISDSDGTLNKFGYNAYRNDNGHFTRIKVDNLGAGIFSDYDNDGFVDFYSSNPYPGTFFRNDGSGKFLADADMPKPGYIKMVDLDVDGFPDIVGSFVFRNPGNGNHWIRTSLRGKQSNAFGIGAQIRVFSGGHCQLQDIRCENDSWSFSSTRTDDPYVPNFGLGAQPVVDSIVVRWPSHVVDKLYNVPVDRLLTVTEGIGDASVPIEFMLSQNYPNPFNGQTSIRYAIPGDGHAPGQKTDVRIEVFDVLGRQVAILQDKPQPPGNYLLAWDGKSKNGIQSATGVYFCRIRAGKHVQTKKMLLLR